MTPAPAWFTPQATERHTIYFPGAEAQALKMRRDVGDKAADDFLADHSMWVEVRGLSAGDRAMMDELKFTREEGGVDGSLEGRISPHESELRAVETCLVAWSFDEPVTKERIRELNPYVVEAIRMVIPSGMLGDVAPVIDGMVATRGEAARANGSGPPSQAVLEPPAPVKDAATAG